MGSRGLERSSHRSSFRIWISPEASRPRSPSHDDAIDLFMMIWKIALFSVLMSGSAFADPLLEGRITVVRDVDTIVVAGTPVRLNGLDGPETSTRVGREAHAFIDRLVRGETVTCRFNGERTYDRWVAVFVKDNCPAISCSVSDFRGAYIGFWIEPDLPPAKSLTMK